MSLFLLTQPDAFYIPKLLDRFTGKSRRMPGGGASVLEGEIAIEPIFRTPTGGDAGFEELAPNIWCQYGMFRQT
jgi:hypothetical protein